MNKLELKRLWVEALNSGKYKQGFGALEKVKPDGTVVNCCLGVLCHVAEDAGVVKSLPRNSDMGTIVGFDLNGEEPWQDEIKQAVGLSVEFERRLVVQNDVELIPFNDIARYIELSNKI